MTVYGRWATPATSVRIGDMTFNNFCDKIYRCLENFARFFLPRHSRTVLILIGPLIKVITFSWRTEVISFTAHCSLQALTYETRRARRRSYKIALRWCGSWNDPNKKASYISTHYLYLVVNMSITSNHSCFVRMVTVIHKIFSTHRNILYGPRFVVY
jgi:hypothetical protein